MTKENSKHALFNVRVEYLANSTFHHVNYLNMAYLIITVIGEIIQLVLAPCLPEIEYIMRSFIALTVVVSRVHFGILLGKTNKWNSINK